MSVDYLDLIRRHCRPTDPIPTSTAPRLPRLTGIRAVLFDVYGTMLTSASGDIGSSAEEAQRQAVTEALAALPGAVLQGAAPSDAGRVIEGFRQTIAASHDLSRSKGIDYPEVDIVEIWRETLAQVAPAVDWSDARLRRFAMEYELRVNPVWPMPGLETTLAELRRRRQILGIVSNAQFFTPWLFPALVDATLEASGFAADLQFFSFAHGIAKPSTRLYALANSHLAARGIRPEQVLYVGNDMLNDVMAAAKVGFRTALFAGDQRSLRWRAGDERVEGVEPDAVVAALPQLLECLCGED